VSESQKCSVQTLPNTPNEHWIIEFASHIQIPKFNYQTALFLFWRRLRDSL